MERAVTVAIIEDHSVVIEGVTSWINADPQQRIQVAQVTPDVTGLASADPGADVIILDLELSGRMITHKIPGLVALAERGVTVDHVTIYRWVRRFTPEFIEAARPCRHAPGDRWFVDETYVKVSGQWTYLYRAVDQHGQVIDVLLSVRRDLAAARRFFTRALRAGTAPAEVTTDRAPVYPRVLDELVPSALHIVEQ